MLTKAHYGDPRDTAASAWDGLSRGKAVDSDRSWVSSFPGSERCALPAPVTHIYPQTHHLQTEYAPSFREIFPRSFGLSYIIPGLTLVI